MNLNPNGDTYFCAFCGTAHEDFEEYAKCVQKCADLKRAEETRKKNEELKKKKDERYKEVLAARDVLKNAAEHYDKMLSSYVEDYGPILFESTLDDMGYLLKSIFRF